MKTRTTRILRGGLYPKKMTVADGQGFSRYEVLMLVARLSLGTAIGFFSVKWIMNQLDLNKQQLAEAEGQEKGAFELRLQFSLRQSSLR